MNKLEAASNVKMILDEATETEEAVCYVTSNDAETLKLAIEALEKWNLVDQYKWERDVVLEQLKEIGCVFGQNMEKEKEAIEKSHPSKLIAKDTIGKTKLNFSNSHHYLCSNCGEYMCNEKEYKLKDIYNYCPNCGQAIDGGQLL